MTEREAMDVDVVIVGAGPAGLSAAIRLKQLANERGTELSVVVLEKAASIGGHILSGALLDTGALDQLLPDWKARNAPISVPVKGEAWSLMTARHSVSIPNRLLPPMLHNEGAYIVSLGEVCVWLAAEAEALGVDIFPGFAATELLLTPDGAVCGVATGDMGRDREGKPRPGFAPGMELRARYTLLAEGARGSLSKQAIGRFALDEASGPQKYGLGFKEVWEVAPDRHREGHAEHLLGWPLANDTSGGGFVYHAADGKVNVGFVVHLNYADPHLSPFEQFQRFKTHPKIAALLEGGTRVAYGARALTSGGWQAIPELAFPGGALIGCAAGFMNVPRIKGSHNAMWSGMKTAEAVMDAIGADRQHDRLETLQDHVVAGPIRADLWPARNGKPLLGRFGTVLGIGLTGLDLWCQKLLKVSPFGTLALGKPDHAVLRRAEAAPRGNEFKPDNRLTFDRLSSVHLANIAHEEDQPVHLKLADPALPVAVNLPLYDEPAQRYCPAAVYEIVQREDGPAFQINAANCIHCKTCDIKDPAANITWVPPEGGSGPNYACM